MSQRKWVVSEVKAQGAKQGGNQPDIELPPSFIIIYCCDLRRLRPHGPKSATSNFDLQTTLVSFVPSVISAPKG